MSLAHSGWRGFAAGPGRVLIPVVAVAAFTGLVAASAAISGGTVRPPLALTGQAPGGAPGSGVMVGPPTISPFAPIPGATGGADGSGPTGGPVATGGPSADTSSTAEGPLASSTPVTPSSSASASPHQTTPAAPRSTAPSGTAGKPSSAPPPAAPPPPPPAPAVPATHWPDASTTGVPAGVSLTSSRAITVTQDGAVVEGLDVSGTITVSAKNVVIRNCRIHGDGSGNGISVNRGSVTIEDTEISAFENAIIGGSWTARRLDIHSTTGDGVKLGSDVLLEDSWIHDLTPAPGAHADGGQMQDGVRNLVVRGNRIDLSTSVNSALFLSPDFGPSTDGPVTIQGNYLSGGGFTLYVVDGNNGQYVVRNITVTGNVFGTSKFGSANVNVPVAWSGNVTTAGRTVNP